MSAPPVSAPPAVLIMGPTASGKTGLAVRLVEEFPMDVISVDSALVYRGMDIGTAKPDGETLGRAPHRLIDIREPEETYSAAQFREDALREMAEITGRGRVPLLVGGTMLYYRALLDGLSELPPADAAIRAKLEARAEREGLDSLHRELQEKDKQAAERIDPNDVQRIQRALEVIELTGEPMSVLQQRQKKDALPYKVLKIVVCPTDRAELHRRIALRFEQMMAWGFEGELRQLHERPGFDPDLPAMRAVGYRQGWPWIQGRVSEEEMREKVLAATRQLAKRQLTWLRREQGALWYDLDVDKAYRGVLAKVRGFLETCDNRSQLIR